MLLMTVMGEVGPVERESEVSFVEGVPLSISVGTMEVGRAGGGVVFRTRSLVGVKRCGDDEWEREVGARRMALER